MDGNYCMRWTGNIVGRKVRVIRICRVVKVVRQVVLAAQMHEGRSHGYDGVLPESSTQSSIQHI